MPCVGFETTIPAFEQAKTANALDYSATVTGGQGMETLYIGKSWEVHTISQLENLKRRDSLRDVGVDTRILKFLTELGFEEMGWTGSE
jgi:hypothetical protein